MQRTLGLVLLAGLVVLAGCGGVLDGGRDAPTVTITPASIPTDESTPIPTPPPPPLPRGVTELGIKDPDTLANAHMVALEDTSYTFHRVHVERYENGTLRERVATDVLVTTNRSHFYYRHNLSGPAARVSAGTNTVVAANGDRVRVAVYADGARILRAITRNNSTTYGVVRNDVGIPFAPEFADLPYISGMSIDDRNELSDVFHSVRESTVERVTPGIDNRTVALYRIRATRLESGWLTTITPSRTFRNASLSVVVDSRGIIHSYRLRYTGVVNGTTIHVTESIRFTDIGETTIERPPWYDEAIAATNVTTNRTTPMTEKNDTYG